MPKLKAPDSRPAGTPNVKNWRVVAWYGGHNFFKGAQSNAMIEVRQNGAQGHFAVIYGLQVKAPLTYAQAAHEFGECVFHLQACEGILGNEGP